MDNKKRTGDYYRNIIETIRKNLESLENERVLYGRFRRIITAIDKNIARRRADLRYYENLLNSYIKDGWAI